MATLTKPLSQAKGFIELLARSNFSFLEGASHPEEIVERAIALGYDGLGLTDIGGLYGVVRGYQVARSPSHFIASPQAKPNFKYIFGSELWLQDGSSLILYPCNKQGYRNLCQLISLSKLHSSKGFQNLSYEQLNQYGEDLLAIPLPPWKEDNLQNLCDLFKQRLYLPVWRDLTYESRCYFQQALHYEEHWGIKLFATQRPLMHTADRKPLLDVLTCILHHTTLSQAHDLLLSNSERHLHSLNDLNALWQDRLDLLNNTLEIATQLNFSLSELRYRYPQAELPSNYSPRDLLQELSEQGLQLRYPNGVPEQISRSLQRELQIIAELKYEDYFLTLNEICSFAKEQNILFQGRGSAANSIICFALGLTAVDPTQIDLLFERFISKERGEPPDIDIDFEHQRREEIIQFIYQRYGLQRAAMVATVIRFRSKMSLRETAKVFGLNVEQINQLVMHMGRDGFRRLEQESEEVKKKFPLNLELLKQIISLAKQLHGFPRHLGIHTGGFVITEDALTELVPIEKASMLGRYVIQWNKDDISNLGLMKVDILSLGMLTAIRKSLELLLQHKQLSYSLQQIPKDDSKTYSMIQKADTIGVFQIESRAQMQTLPRLGPKTFYDLVIQIALIRPGPLQGNMVHPFLKRRSGLEKVEYAHPDLIPILKKTLGIPIFQEQIMRMAVRVAGFSPGEADELRRVMSSSWTHRNAMAGVKDKVLRGMQQHGLTQFYAEQVFKAIEGFSAYGFPESHSASFAHLTYVSAWLKCHHPEVFFCSLLNAQPMGFYSARTLISELQRNQIPILPLDVNISEYEYTLEKNNNNKLGLRLGFCSLHGFSRKHAENLVQQRKSSSGFSHLSDFIKITKLSRSSLLKLAGAGAFQQLPIHETQGPLDIKDSLWHISAINLDSQSLTYTQARNTFTDDHLLPQDSQWQALERDYQQYGFSLLSHPVALIRKTMLLNLQHSKSLPRCLQNRVIVMGLMALTQRPPTAKGFCFVTLEDEFGLINIVIEPNIYEKYRLIIYQQGFIAVSGKIEKRNGVINIKAERLWSITKESKSASNSDSFLSERQ